MLVFGETGVEKALSLTYSQEVALLKRITSDATGRIPKSTSYVVDIDCPAIRLWDTSGLKGKGGRIVAAKMLFLTSAIFFAA